MGVIVLTGQGPEAFCSGGDQRVRGDAGYLAEDDAAQRGVGRFHVTDLQVQIRRTAQAGGGDGGGLRDRRRARAAHRLRPDDRRRQRPLRAGRPPRGQLRRRLRRGAAGPAGGPQEGQGDLVPVPPVQRGGGRAHGPGQHGRAPGRAGGGDGALVSRDAGPLPLRAAPAEGQLQRRRGRPHRAAAAGARHQPAVLRLRGGAGGPRRLRGQAPADFSRFPRRP